VSNKTIDPVLDFESGESMTDSDSSRSRRESSEPACTKCGASKIAQSRLQRFDDLKMRFVAKRPYRCLHCYHRFWVAETFGASSKRVWTLAIAGIFFILLLFKLFDVFSASDSRVFVNVTEPEFNKSTTTVESTPSLASLINMPRGVSDSKASVDVQASVQGVSVSPQAFEQTAEDLLTPEQKARQLLLAKQESEAAEQLSQARVEQLEQVLLPADDELESLVKVEVGYMVERWREAWSKGDIDGYLFSYSSDFTPSNNMTLEAWEANRKSRVRPEKNISLKLSDFDVAMLEGLNSGVVEFDQLYQSGDYVENSRKRLSFVKEQGSWKITSEIELASE